MESAKVIPIRDPAREINEEHELVLRSDADRMKHYIRCGELLLAKRAEFSRRGDGFKAWVVENCQFGYKTAADYMRSARDQSRGLDHSSLDGMKQAARKPLAAKASTPEKPKTIGWTVAATHGIDPLPSGFALDTIRHKKKQEVESEYGSPIPARVVPGSEEAKGIREALLRLMARRDTARHEEAKVTARAGLEEEFARKHSELQQSFQESVRAEIERRLPDYARSEIAEARTAASEAERLEGVWRSRARACKAGAGLLLDNWRLFTLCLHPDRAPEDRRDQFSRATDLLLRIRKAFDEVSYDKW